MLYLGPERAASDRCSPPHQLMKTNECRPACPTCIHALENAAPLTSLRPQHDDKLENVEVPSFEEVEISESGFAHCEPAYPKRLPPQFSQKLVVPQTGTLRKMPGFTFFVENSHFHAGNSNQYSVPVDEMY